MTGSVSERAVGAWYNANKKNHMYYRYNVQYNVQEMERMGRALQCKEGTKYLFVQEHMTIDSEPIKERVTRMLGGCPETRGIFRDLFRSCTSTLCPPDECFGMSADHVLNGLPCRPAPVGPVSSLRGGGDVSHV